METTPQHHYTFRMTWRNPDGALDAPVFQRVGVAAHAPFEADSLVRAHFPTLEALELSSIEPLGDGCGDDRCSVCNPSSRNRRP
jgi:hypothetical protein